MASHDRFDTDIVVPDNVKASVYDNTVHLEGPKGTLSRTFIHPRFTLSFETPRIFIKSTMQKPNRADKMLINTCRAHIRNLIKGTQEGYHAELKVCSGHFPITVAVEGSMFVVKNFLGEKYPRKTSLYPGVKVVVSGETITVDGLDIEAVGQTAACIEQSTRITNRDRRIFQDGCYITKKP
ncbi:50S ribosomal protein L6 [Candidatus Woesearchaeota archaeon]|nr:50S ribosomal protein L6 [Candidatus Woesearchaeota archaeon]